jgi:hypothetical protein
MTTTLNPTHLIEVRDYIASLELIFYWKHNILGNDEFLCFESVDGLADFDML